MRRRERSSRLLASAAFAAGSAPRRSGRWRTSRRRIIYQLMLYGAAYVKETEAAYAEQVRAPQEKQLLRRAKS